MDNELYDYRKYDQVWKRVNPPMYQTLLREELRHMQEVLRVLENALA